VKRLVMSSDSALTLARLLGRKDVLLGSARK